jgi:hypothetical protein
LGMGSADGERRKKGVSKGQTTHLMILNDSSKELLPHETDFPCGTHLWVKQKVGVALSSRLFALLGRPPVTFTNPKKAIWKRKRVYLRDPQEGVRGKSER